MSTTRREFLPHTRAAQAAAGAAKIRIGACVVGLDQARQAGMEGVVEGTGAAAYTAWDQAVLGLLRSCVGSLPMSGPIDHLLDPKSLEPTSRSLQEGASAWEPLA